MCNDKFPKGKIVLTTRSPETAAFNANQFNIMSVYYFIHKQLNHMS